MPSKHWHISSPTYWTLVWIQSPCSNAPRPAHAEREQLRVILSGLMPATSICCRRDRASLCMPVLTKPTIVVVQEMTFFSGIAWKILWAMSTFPNFMYPSIILFQETISRVGSWLNRTMCRLDVAWNCINAKERVCGIDLQTKTPFDNVSVDFLGYFKGWESRTCFEKKRESVRIVRYWVVKHLMVQKQRCFWVITIWVYALIMVFHMTVLGELMLSKTIGV